MALLKISSSDDSWDNLLLMASGIALMIDGGWLLFVLTYCGMFPGFMKGWCFPVVRDSVTSR